MLRLGKPTGSSSPIPAGLRSVLGGEEVVEESVGFVEGQEGASPPPSLG